MTESRIPNPLVEQFLKGGVPQDLRMLAAQGALPLKTEDLVELLHHLLRDPVPQVGQTAEATLRGISIDDLTPVLKARETPAAILAWALQNREEPKLREAVLQNVSTPDDAVERVAGRLPENLAELVVINQVRLLRSTALLVALESNPGLSNDQKRRLRELRESFHIGDAAASAAAPQPAAPPPAAVPEAAPEPEPEPEPDGPPLSEEQAVFQYLSEEERQESSKLTAVQKVYKMNTAEKVVAALKGTREERAVLVRDRNRIVCTAVLGSPKVTEAEIEQFAGMKNVPDEVLRTIAGNREWTKKYPVVLNLIKNPRTPVALSIGMVSRLNPRDMKALTTDRNVSEVLRKTAQKFVVSKISGKGGGS
jgi:hypothetical protein